MITVEYSFDDSLLLRVTGHADHSRENDIVCAGVSALTESLASFISSKGYTASIRLGRGYAEIYSREHEALPFFHFTLHGISLICAEYPDNIKIIKQTL